MVDSTYANHAIVSQVFVLGNFLKVNIIKTIYEPNMSCDFDNLPSDS